MLRSFGKIGQNSNEFQSIVLYIVILHIHSKLSMMNSNPFLASPASKQHMVQRREKDFKLDARYIEQIRNAQLIKKKLLMHKKGVLPSIQTTNNKASFNKLFSPNQDSNYSPVRRYDGQQQFNKQTKVFYNQAEIYASKVQKICQRKELANETIEQKKIGKSFSEIKCMGHLQEISGQAILAFRKLQHTGKMVTQESATSTSSKHIYERLNQLRNRDKFMTVQKQSETAEKDNLKQYKHSSFVIKFKVAQSHHLEREQLRTLKNSRNDNHTSHLRENIKIKNYTKFFSNEFDLPK